MFACLLTHKVEGHNFLESIFCDVIILLICHIFHTFPSSLKVHIGVFSFIGILFLCFSSHDKIYAFVRSIFIAGSLVFCRGFT